MVSCATLLSFLFDTGYHRAAAVSQAVVLKQIFSLSSFLSGETLRVETDGNIPPAL